MKVLRKRLFRILPAWLLLILLFGTATAAFLWISNKVRNSVYVYERPIFLESVPQYASMTYYVDEPQEHQVNFTVNDPARAEGYVVYNFTMVNPADKWTSINDMAVYMEVFWHPTISEYGSLHSMYPKLADSNRTVTWLFEWDNGTHYLPFNFSDPLMQGYIIYEVEYFNVVPNHYVDVQITSSP